MADKIRALYVDDEPDLLEIAKVFLEESGECTVTTAQSAHDAIRLLEQVEFDAIISDYQMPGMDGIQLLGKVREQFGSVPFILFTGKGREEVVIQAINSGVDFYLQKGGEPRAQFAELSHKVKSAASKKMAEDALRESEDTFRVHIENSFDVIFTLDSEGKFIFISPAWERHFGYPEREAIGKLFVPFVHPDDVAPLVEYLNRILNTGQSGTSPAFRVRHADGRWLWFVANGTPYVNTKGERQFIGVGRDITRQKRAENALQVSEGQKIAILNGITSNIAFVDRDLKILWANKVAAGSVNKLPAEIIGRTCHSLWADPSRPCDNCPTLKVFQTKQSEHRIMHTPDGRVWDERGEPVLDEDGDLIGVVEIAADISERKLMEEALRDSEEKYRGIFDGSIAAIYVFDTKKTFVNTNQAGLDLLGYSREELLHMGISDVDADPGVVLPAHQELLSGGCLINYEHQLRRKDGRIITVLNNSSPLTDSHGNVVGMLSTLIDITGRKQLEGQLRIANTVLSAQAESSVDGILVVDESGTIISCNRRFSEICGVAEDVMASGSDERALQAVLDKLVSPEEFLSKIQYLYAHREEKSRDELYLRNGRLIERYTAPVTGSAGEYYGRVWYFRDISEHKQMEETLKQQSATLSILNDIITTANNAEDLPGLLDNILGESLRLMDFDAGGIYLVDRSKRTADIVHFKNIPPGFLAEIQTVHIDKKPYDTLFIQNEPIFNENFAEISPVHPENSGFFSMASVPLLSKGVAIGALNIASTRRQFISAGEKSVLIAIGREIGSTIERMAAEEEVKKARNNFETLFNSIDEMVFVLDMQGRILTVNDAVLKRLMYTPGELTGTDILLLHVPERREEALRNVEGMIAGTIDSCPVPILAKDGTRIEVETKVSRGTWNSQEVLIGMSRDVTERKRAGEALQQSEEKHRILVDNSHDIIYTINREGIFTFVSPSWTTHLGHQVDQVIGRSISEFVHPDDIPRCIEFMHEMINTGQRQTGIEYRVKHTDGSWRWHITNAVPLRDNTGMIVGGEGSASDITIRKQVEEALKDSEEKFRGIFDTMNDAVHIHEIEPDGRPGKFIEVNEVACRMLQYTHAELLEHGPMDLVTGYHSRPLDEIIGELSSIGHSIFETEHRRKDGTVIPVEVNSHVVILQKKRVMVGVVRDITERKRSEEALRKSEEKIRLLLNSAAEGIYGLDMEGNCTFCNNSCLHLLGYQHQDDLLGRNMHWQIHAKHPDGSHFPVEECHIFQAFNKGEKTHVDDEVLWRADGTSFPAEYWSYPQRHDDKVVGAVVTFLDITERKSLENEMKFHEEELMQFGTSLAAANRKLTLLSGITRHDINNQLTVLMGFLSIAERKMPDTTLNEYFEKINTAAERISAMIRFTKEYEEIGVHAPAWQDCRTLVDTAAKQAPLGKIMLENDLPAGLEVFADPLIAKVCYNLMDNAARYGGKITTIRFSALESRDGHRFICEDDGAGVPAEEKEKIFERGFGKNTGMGLALSREILSITGITIYETGGPGKGARFEMTVPGGAWRIGGQGE